MTVLNLTSIMLICLAIGSAGCNRVESESSEPASESAEKTFSNRATDSHDAQAKQGIEKEGWALYSPPERDFSVMAPEHVEVNVRETKVGKFREYVFRNGEAFIAVEIHTNRKQPLAGNLVEELKSDMPDHLPGSLRDISLDDMAGIEYRMTGSIGESIFRDYCASDNSRTISIQVAKDYDGGFTDDEIRLFLDSFKSLD